MPAGFMSFTIKPYYPYMLISLLAIIWNVLTIHNQLPWMDEVMLADTPANLLLYGEWTTTAYNAMGEGTFPFSTYMPLYQWTLFIWMRIFGFSFLSVRLFEIISYFVLGFVIIKLLEICRNKSACIYEQCLFSIAFWFTSILALTYRIGRPDILGALMSLGLVYNIILSIKSSNIRKWYIIIYSILTILAGIQSVVWCLSMLVFSSLFVRPIKNLLKPTWYAFIGFLVGFVTTSLFMWYHGALKAFYVTLMQVSGTIYKLWQLAREYVLPLFGRDVKTIADLPANEGFFSRMAGIGHEKSTLVLIGIVLILIIYNNPIKAWKEKSTALLFGCFGFFTILFFTLAGRYALYYQWTAVIPLIASLTLWYNYKNKIANKIIVIFSLVIIIVFSCSSFGDIFDERYNNVRDFIKRQAFQSNHNIAAPMMTFYELRPITTNIFFYEIYPEEYIKKLDFLIIPQPLKDQYHPYYNYDNMHRYFNHLTSSGYSLTAIDSITNPALILYSVKK